MHSPFSHIFSGLSVRSSMLQAKSESVKERRMQQSTQVHKYHRGVVSGQQGGSSQAEVDRKLFQSPDFRLVGRDRW